MILIENPFARGAGTEFNYVHRGGAVLGWRRWFFVEAANQLLCELNRQWLAVAAVMLEIVAIQQLAIGEHGPVFIDVQGIALDRGRRAGERSYTAILVVHGNGMHHGHLARHWIQLNDV